MPKIKQSRIYFKRCLKNIKLSNPEIIFWGGLLIVMLFRIFYFGIDYFNYLDDNNTYGVFYRRNADIWNDIIKWYGLYTFRPIAFFCDAYITQWFWPAMWLVLLFYTIQHFLTVWLFKKTMDLSGFKFGLLGIVVLSFTPILLEAVYWIGASTRLVPGVFFSVLSCFVLLKFLPDINAGKLWPFSLYAVLNLISTGFYEQIIVFNFIFTLIIIGLNIKKMERLKRPIISVPFISTLIIGVYYIIFWNQGKAASRGQMADSGLVNMAVSTLKGIFNILVKQNIEINLSGLRAFPALGVNPCQAFMLMFTIFFFVYACKVFAKINYTNRISFKYAPALAMILGIILAATPFAPFFVLKNNYMSLRAAYTSVFGIALFAEGVFEALPLLKKPLLVLTCFVGLLFFAISVTEINNYRLIEADDDIIAANFLSAFEDTGLPEDSNIAVFGIKYLYTETSRPGYENIASSDWAFLGKVNAVSDKYYFKHILPVTDGGLLNKDYLDSESVLFTIGQDMNIERVFLKDNELRNQDGDLYGYLNDEGDYYNLEIKD